MLRVATVLSAREWEARLVAAARDAATIRLVLRAFLPDEVGSQAEAIDVVVAGAETPWVTPTRVAAWRRLGLRVVGLHARADRPARDRLTAGGADLVLADDLDAEQIVREIRLLDASTPEATNREGSMTAVTGVAGGSGVTEIAVALAWNAAGRGDCVLVDGNLPAPALAIRLGLPPRPDLADVFDHALGNGGPTLEEAPRVGRLAIVPGPLRPSDPGLKADVVADMAIALSAHHSVVVDVGSGPQATPVIREADRVVLVVSGTPTGIVRLARAVEGWTGPQPDLVLNMVPAGRRHDVVLAARRWSGLDPVAVVPVSRRVMHAGASGADPHRTLRRRLLSVDDGHAR